MSARFVEKYSLIIDNWEAMSEECTRGKVNSTHIKLLHGKLGSLKEKH